MGVAKPDPKSRLGALVPGLQRPPRPYCTLHAHPSWLILTGILHLKVLDGAGLLRWPPFPSVAMLRSACMIRELAAAVCGPAKRAQFESGESSVLWLDAVSAGAP